MNSDDVAEQDRDRVVTIRDQDLARGQAVDDPLRQNVEQQPLRAGSLLLELREQPRHERRVRILELLEPANVALEPLEPPGEAAVLLLELVVRARARLRVRPLRRQCGVATSAAADPSRTETSVALWKRVRSAVADGAISPRQ